MFTPRLIEYFILSLSKTPTMATYRRVAIISMKILMEFVNGDTIPQNTSNTDHSTFHDPQQQMDLIASCLDEQNNEDGAEQRPGQDNTQWQWWLGRLTFIRRLFDEHHSQLLLASQHRINMSSSLPVSPNSDVDLREFLNSLAENVHTETRLSEKTCQRILLLARFSAGALTLCSHSKVHKHALFLIVKCIAISSQDASLYPHVKQIVYGLKSNHQSTLHRHLSNESQREQADILTILDEHGDDIVAEEQEGHEEREHEQVKERSGTFH